MTDFMDRYFRYLKAGQKEYTEAEVRAIIDGAIQEKRRWMGLTDEDIEQCAIDDGSDDLIFARAIEAKLKEKNCG